MEERQTSCMECTHRTPSVSTFVSISFYLLVITVYFSIFFSLDVDVETSVNHEAAILWKEDKKR